MQKDAPGYGFPVHVGGDGSGVFCNENLYAMVPVAVQGFLMGVAVGIAFSAGYNGPLGGD